jgi:hypothetical protein
VKKAFLIFVLAVSLTQAGCPKGAYHDAVIAEHSFKTAVGSFQKAELIEFQMGRISPEEHKVIEAQVEKIALAGQALTQALQSGATSTTVNERFGLLSQALSDLLKSGVLGIKNENSKMVLQVAIVTAQDILQNVSQFLPAGSF